MQNKLAFIIPLIFLNACTQLKLEDLQKMSTAERADYLCLNDSSVKEYQNKKNGYNSIVNQINQDLTRGYKIHRSCRNVSVQTSTSVHCNSYNSSGSIQTDCQQNPNTEEHQECTETPVSIDTALEKQKLIQYTAMANVAEKQVLQLYDLCYEKTILMSPEEAYQFYKK